MTNGNDFSSESREKEVKAIGAFCTDIENSVDSIDTHGDKAFRHHAAYIEKVAEAYGRQLKIHKVTKSSMRTLMKRSHFWIPGDALWGVFFEEPEKSLNDSIIASFTRLLNACAYGLVQAHNEALQLQVEHLRIRGAMIGGQVLEKELKDLKSTLYNGSSLNACGRLQGEAASNSVILGFVLPANEPGTGLPLDLNIGSPEMPLSEFSDCMEQLKLGYPDLSLCKPGCELNFETVQAGDGKKLIRFTSLPKKIRGLKNCNVILTRVKLEIDDKNRGGIHMHDRPAGSWARSTVTVANNPGELSLTDLVAQAPDINFTLPPAYRGDRVKIQVPGTPGEDFILHYQGKMYRPRAGKRKRPARTVDFKEYGYCFLQLFRVTHSDNVLLIRRGKNKSLVLHEIPDRINRRYDDLSDFTDSAGECAEFIFS